MIACLELSEEKTNIHRVTEGFDFRRYTLQLGYLKQISTWK
jgi:hypothetical protein